MNFTHLHSTETEIENVKIELRETSTILEFSIKSGALCNYLANILKGRYVLRYLTNMSHGANCENLAHVY